MAPGGGSPNSMPASMNFHSSAHIALLGRMAVRSKHNHAIHRLVYQVISYGNSKTSRELGDCAPSQSQLKFIQCSDVHILLSDGSQTTNTVADCTYPCSYAQSSQDRQQLAS